MKQYLYLATFICRSCPETGLVPLMFQAIIAVNFDLNKRFLESKNDDEIRAINREIFASNNVKSFLPGSYQEQEPERIMYWQELGENNG